MIVYGKRWSEKGRTAPIFYRLRPVYVPPTLGYEIYTRIQDMYRAGIMFVQI